MQAILARLAEGRDLTSREAAGAMELIAEGRATEAQIASLITALRFKGETAEEITAFARVLQGYALSIRPVVNGRLVDTCGTGGDRSGTFNISTTAALVAAGAGVPVVKHGNRSVSSSCGSADVLEALGVQVNIPPHRVSAIVEKAGIGFLFAPSFHPALKYAAKARKDLGFSTIFNLLGPLLNPADAQARLCGVFSPTLIPKFASTICSLGTARAMVVHGDGLDEITTSGETHVAEVEEGTIRRYTLTPEQFGIPRSPVAALTGNSPRENAEIIRNVLSGGEGPARDVVVMNAGAAIYLGGKSIDLSSGITRAEHAIDSGAAAEKLRVLIRMSEEHP